MHSQLSMLKKLFLLIVPLCFLLPTAAHAVTIGEANPLSSGLVGYWTFDGSMTNWATGSALDSSGNAYSGILANLSTTTSPSPGKIGQALRFNSSAAGQMVTLGDNYSPASGGSWTYSIWAKPIGDGNSGYLFAKYENDVGSGLFIRASAGNLWGCVSNFGACSVSSAPIKQNVWQLITLVYNASNSTLYIYQDGTQVFSQVQTPVANTKDFTIGNRYLDDRRFNGWLDDMRIYNRALSAQEVKELYKTGAATIAQSNTNSLSSGLAGYWTFDGSKINWSTGSALDSTGNANTGSLSGMTTTTSPVAGKMGQALNFNGSSQYATLPRVVSDDFTISFWIKTTQSAQFTGSGCAGNTQWYCGWSLVDAEMAGVANDFGTSLGNGKIRFGVGNSDTTITSNATVNTGQWVLVTATRVKSTGAIKLYINGQFDISGTGNTNSLTAPSNIWISNNGGGLGNYFNGYMDDVRIYNRALSTQEVQELYNIGAAKVASSNTVSLSSGLIGYWTLDGSKTNWSTGRTQDSSGNGNTAQFVSISTTTSPIAGKVGQALKLNGSSSYIDAGNNSSLSITGPITLSTWVRHDSNSFKGWDAIITKGDTAYRLHTCNGICNGGSINGFGFSINSGFGNDSVGSTVIPTKGVWYYVTATYDLQNLKLYINGVLVNTQSDSNSIGTNSTNVAIGENLGSVGRQWEGAIDDVRIYNRALSAQEIRQLYNATK